MTKQVFAEHMLSMLPWLPQSLTAVLSGFFVSNTFATSNLITEPSARKMETTSCLTTAAREIIFSRRNGKRRNRQGDHQHNWVNRITLLVESTWQYMPLVSKHHQLCLCSDLLPKPVWPTNWCRALRQSGGHQAICLPALQQHVLLVAISLFFSKFLGLHQTNCF